jgi:hypothetical protein
MRMARGGGGHLLLCSNREGVNYGKGVPFAFQFGYIIAIIQAVKLAAMAGSQSVLDDLEGWKNVRDKDGLPPPSGAARL